MHHSLLSLPSLIVALVAGSFVGCSGSPHPMTSDSHAEGKDHHEGDGHEHGHAAEGPHHGHLIELGKEEYHAELTHDEASKTMAVYLLDSSAKVSVPIPDPEILINVSVGGKPTQYKLAAVPEASDPPGQSSKFSLTNAELLDALEAPKMTGRLNVTIKGQSYIGPIEHEEHAEHTHK